MAERKMDLKPNSDKAKRQEEERKKPTKRAQQVTSLQHVTMKKKGFIRRFLDKYLESDAESVKTYIVKDVILPLITNAIYDGISGSLEMVLPGVTPRTKKKKGESNVSYTAYYKSNSGNNSRNDTVNRNPRLDLDDIIFESSGEAEAVRDQLVDLTTDYQQATVADLYDCLGVTVTDWTIREKQENYGWTSLASSRIRKVPGGWRLVLPPPEKL